MGFNLTATELVQLLSLLQNDIRDLEREIIDCASPDIFAPVISEWNERIKIERSIVEKANTFLTSVLSDD